VLVDDCQRVCAHVRGCQGLPAPGVLVKLTGAEMPLEFYRPQASKHIKQLKGIADVDARICQPGKRVCANLFACVHHLARERAGRPEVHRPVHSPRCLLDLAAEGLAFGDLLCGWDADGLGDRERMHCMPGWALQLSQDVPKQILAHDSPVVREIAGERDRVAVDHRANAVMIVDLVQREYPAHALGRICSQPPDAVAESGAEQVLHDVAFQVGPTCHRGAIEEERAVPILQVGVEQ